MMKNRKPNRMAGYDYSLPGYYFITICVKDRIPVFGRIESGADNLLLNQYGEIIERQWLWLGDQYNYIIPGEFIVMPDHFHGIIVIRDEYAVGTGRDLSLRKIPDTVKIKPLDQIIGVFKTTTSKHIHLAGCENFRWQRSFYDRIIRDQNELNLIRKYIKENPSRWQNRNPDN